MASRAQRRATDPKAAAQLEAALSLLNLQNNPTPAAILSLRDYVGTALELLMTPDPVLERNAFTLIALRQSTSVTSKIIRGKVINRVSILDQDIYAWSLAEVHRLGDPAYVDHLREVRNAAAK